MCISDFKSPILQNLFFVCHASCLLCQKTMLQNLVSSLYVGKGLLVWSDHNIVAWEALLIAVSPIHTCSTMLYFSDHHAVLWTQASNSVWGQRYFSGKVSASQLKGWMFEPRPLSELPWNSLGKSVHLNHPDKKQISNFLLSPVVVTQTKKAVCVAQTI